MRVLLLNQTFFPDVVSTAQHAADLARALVGQEHRVTVVCSRRAYDAPASTFPARGEWAGVTIIRTWSTGFGKGSRWRRAFDFGSFLVSCLCRSFTLGSFDCVVALTSPPLVSFGAYLFARITGTRLVLWLMDINPDEAVAAGWLRAGSFAERALSWCLRKGLQGASHVVVLDRFMRDRVIDKGVSPDRLAIIAPWVHSDAVHLDIEGRERFRRLQGLERKFVVMYSGNHSLCHPLDSLLAAALELRTEPDLVFCFIGGGSEFKKVKEFAAHHRLANITCLPYQPLNDLSASLSAADLHVVVMGNPFVGIVHPCKIYNIMALGAPVLYVGPDESHITDIGGREWIFASRHDDVSGIVRNILDAREAGPRRYEVARLQAREFAQDHLVKRLAAVITDGHDVARVCAPSVAPVK